MSFGENLRTARKNRDLTQKQLAEIIDVKHNSISNWENDQNRPGPDTIELLCGALNISPNQLLSSKQKNAPDQTAESDVGNIMDTLRDKLRTEHTVMYNGVPLSRETADALLASIDATDKMTAALAEKDRKGE